MPRRIRILVMPLLLFAGPAGAAVPVFTVNSTSDVPGGGNLANAVCETATGTVSARCARR